MNRLAQVVEGPRIILWAAGALILLTAGWFVWQEVRIGGELGFPLDDAWIHCQYARNLAEGRGYVYVPGDPPTPGSTSPLWTLLLAGAFRFSSECVLTAKLLGLALFALLVWLTYRAAQSLGQAPWIAGLAAILVALSARLTWGSLSGMEISLYAALTVAGLWWHTAALPYLSTAAFALAALSRPECYLLFPLAWLDRLLVERLLWKRVSWGGFFRQAAAHSALYLAILAPNLAFNYAAIGHLFPTTFYAKVKGGLLDTLLAGDMLAALRLGATNGVNYMISYAAYLAETNLFLLVPAAFGWVAMALAPLRRAEERASWFLPLTFVAYPLIVGTVFWTREGFGGVITRYVANLGPLYALLAAIGVGALGRYVATQAQEHPHWARRAVGLTTALALAYALAAEAQGGIQHGWMVENTNHFQVALGKWVDANIPRDALIAVNDVGAIEYFSNRRLLDLVGLVTPDILPYIQASDGPQGEPEILEYVRQRRPDYIIVYPKLYPALTSLPNVREIYSVEVANPVIVQSGRQAVYQATWP